MPAGIRPIHVITFAFVATYLATVGIGAALFPFEFGQRELSAFMWPTEVPLTTMTTLGAPSYWALLFSTAILIPAIAFAIERSATRTLPFLTQSPIATWIPITLAALLSSYCLYKLAAAGGLTMREVWDRSVCYMEKMERRVELMHLLGNRYYAFAYSSLPIIGSFLLAKAVMRKDRLALMGFGAVSVLLVWLDIAMIMKAPLIIYIGVVGLTLALSGFGILRSTLLAGVIALGTYFGLSMLQFCVQQPKSWNLAIPDSPSQISVSEPSRVASAASTMAPTSIAAAPSTSSSPDKAPTPPSAQVPPTEAALPSTQVSTTEVTPSDHSDLEKSLSYKAWYMARAVVFRMSAAFPYYVETFSDPDQRCGIELPLGQLFPRQSCFGPKVIFHKMYPEIQYVTGFAPAGATLSAYGEAGPLYAAVVIILGGVVLGMLAFLANGSTPFSVSLCVASCVFAYYLTQTSFTGSIIDGYGLIWMLLPLFIMKAISSRASVLVARFSMG